ncbi:MAG TPA: hypothetical protein VFA29_04325 [Candidatus Baltobacteraceae bacterium]|nr:hypothetical protein [Candidatus Baltobacteraceae bacterium]
MMHTYLKLFVLVALVLAVLAILHFVLPLIIMAAVVAALILGGMFLFNFLRREIASIER